MLRFLLVLAALWAPVLARAGGAADAWWVWQPGAEECADLAKNPPDAKDGILYWHRLTLRVAATGPVAGQEFAAPPSGWESRVVPVARVEGGAFALERPESANSIRAALRGMARTKPSMVQVDFDCPQRLLPKYAAWLAELRHEIAPVRLSVTALAGWAPLDATWREAADEIVPMFYDLKPDAPADAAAGRFQPPADADGCGVLLEKWKPCPVAWRCGLADFTRLTRFGADGRSFGHLRSWRLDEVMFSPTLGPAAPGPAGVWSLPVLADGPLAGTTWKSGDRLVARCPDPAALQAMEAKARACGATGVAWFFRPSGKAADGWSIAHIHHRGEPGAWTGQVGIENNRLVLTGDSIRDLPPNWSGDRRGWALEVESDQALFRDASPGGFFRLEPTDASGQARPLVSATRLAWRFARLPAGGCFQTGPVTLAEGAKWSGLRWRVRGPGLSEDWKIFP